MKSKYSCVVIAGLSGDSGKTLVSCGLISALKKRNKKVASFKKGPDYIDSAWLGLASGNSCYNLDNYLMSSGTVLRSFLVRAKDSDISIIEGNRGLYDGFDSAGTYSTAELAKLIDTPVILVINVTKVTRTVAAIVLGCQKIDKNLNLAGIIINRVAGKRHQRVVTEAIEKTTGIPVVGAIPKIKGKEVFPSRHLGLVTPDEHELAQKAIDNASEIVEEYVDIEKIIEIADNATQFENEIIDVPKKCSSKDVKIGYFSDRAFSFYYPENLEALELKGAELVKISSIEDKVIPEIDALYIGGGFPETNIENLTENRDLMRSLKVNAEDGLPIYAECGGLMYLARTIEIDGIEYPLSNVLPIKVKMNKKPQGHGYMDVVIDRDNPFYAKGELIRGHEFHYSSIIEQYSELPTCMKLNKGTGCFEKRDGIVYKNVFASYLHLHTLTTEVWSDGMMRQARKRKSANY